MTDPDSYNPGPPPPAARPAASLAAVLLLVIVFFVGLAVGQSGVLSPASTPSTPVSVVGSPGSSPGPLPSMPADAPANFGLFWQALDTIRQNYVGRSDLTDQQITYGAIKGMVDALGDTAHTVFLTKEAVQASSESLSGKLVGIGVLLGQTDNQVVIISVVPGSPADAAGLKSGDVITAVDGTSVSGLSREEVVPKVRGEAGSTVQVTVQRPSTGETFDYSIVRAEIHFPAASWSMVPGTNIALLRLLQFSSGSAAELLAARDAATAAGATSFVLDLRSNPGGYVPEAVDTASLFLKDKTVYILEDAHGSRTPQLTNDHISAIDAPMVVLVDQGTASSSEIVAAALKSAGRAELVGETTFGTGTVLDLFPLADGSAIRLATQRWLTPDGDLIFGKGITPTIELAEPSTEIPLDPREVSQLTPDQVATMPDSQLLRAIQILSGTAPPQASPAPPSAAPVAP